MALPYAEECLTDEEFVVLKTRMTHLIYSDRTENEILDIAKKTLSRRRIWVTEESPTAAEFLQQFPRFTDTPPLV
jgi:hypothetical protein